MRISQVRIRVICYDWDNPDDIVKGMLNLLKGIEKINIKESKGKGLVSTELKVYEVVLKKKKDIQTFLRNLAEITDIENIMKNVNLDERCAIYIRLDKKLLTEGKGFALYSGDVYHIKISIDEHKKDKERVLKELKDILEKIKYEISSCSGHSSGMRDTCRVQDNKETGLS